MPVIKITSHPIQETLNPILLSHEVMEVITHRPVWIVRHGIMLFLCIVCCLLLLTFFISYPDVVKAKAKLLSVNSPKEIKAKTAGKLIRLHAKEGRFVEQGQLLGFMESNANAYEIIALSQLADRLHLMMEAGETSLLPAYFQHPFHQLGEVQPAYQQFMQSFTLFRQYLSSGYYLKKKVMFQNDIVYLQRLHKNLVQQKAMQEEDLLLAQKTFLSNQTLIDEKVISELDYRNEKSKLIGKSLSIPQVNAAIINNESIRHEKQKEIMQLDNEIGQQKAIFCQALNTLRAHLEDWKNKYLLTAPVAGNVLFVSAIQENQQIQTAQTVCFINPGNTKYFAELSIPQYNFGKIKIGQHVLLKLASYPEAEFGNLKGRLDYIYGMPTDSGYGAKVLIPQGLLTNFNKQLQYREGLVADAEIITADLKLSAKLFSSLRSLLKH